MSCLDVLGCSQARLGGPRRLGISSGAPQHACQCVPVRRASCMASRSPDPAASAQSQLCNVSLPFRLESKPPADVQWSCCTASTLCNPQLFLGKSWKTQHSTHPLPIHFVICAMIRMRKAAPTPNAPRRVCSRMRGDCGGGFRK